MVMKKLISIILALCFLTSTASGDDDYIYGKEYESEPVKSIYIQEEIQEEVEQEVKTIYIFEDSEKIEINEDLEKSKEIIEETAPEFDLTQVSNKTPEELSVYMHPETRHLAKDVVRICSEYGVNAEFIAAIMRWERRPDLHNWFGWYGADGPIIFESDIQCLETVIPRIRQNYLEPDGCYYNGPTVDGVSIFYNNSDFWRETIKNEMERMI